MIEISDYSKIDFDAIPVDTFWNMGRTKGEKMHRIHTYPAKLPAFLPTKALEYTKNEGLKVQKIADVFCGCGTVAYVAVRNRIDFWGCDINPIATMITRAKSRSYQQWRLNKYFKTIVSAFENNKMLEDIPQDANERLKYWYDEKQFKSLSRLQKAITMTVPHQSDYMDFFNTAFSNILKSTSRWLTKSIKPQIDPFKVPTDVMTAFIKQYNYMLNAFIESKLDNNNRSKVKIVTDNFLGSSLSRPIVDLIITSPPYVTSYEYADLHQLSTLWLGYTKEYRDLRHGSIGSLYHVYDFKKCLKLLNTTGSSIVFRLYNEQRSKARSVAKYFLDMQKTGRLCANMLTPGGMAFFVIGDTQYKGVRIENTRHLIESLFNGGFKKVKIAKRNITKKILTPYRDKFGKFSSDSNNRKVYSEEFLVLGKK